MAFKIHDFISNMNQFGERAAADKFDVMIALPTALTNGGNAFGARMLNLQCEAAELPSIDVVPIEYRHYAFIKRIPHHLVFTPLTLTFYCNGQLLEKQLFDSWINLLINVSGQTPGLIQYRDDDSGMPQYEGTIDVRQYDMSGNIIYDAQAIEAMPLSISAMNVNWSDDSTHRVTVTFAFTKWSGNQVQSSSSGAQSNFSLPTNNFSNFNIP